MKITILISQNIYKSFLLMENNVTFALHFLESIDFS